MRENEFKPDWKIRQRNRCAHKGEVRIRRGDGISPAVDWCKDCGAVRLVYPHGPNAWRAPKVAFVAQRQAEELQDIKDTHRHVINDDCAPDEKHCACVPFLRAEIKKLKGEREVAGACALCEQCYVNLTAEDGCDLTPTRGDDGLLKCPSFLTIPRSGD